MMKYTPLIVLALICTGCESGTSSVDDQQQAKQETSLQEAARQIGMPNIKNFQEMKEVKHLYELRDNADLVTFTYITDYNGHLRFLTRSIGYGLPYATQFSNPQKVSDHISGGGWLTMPQAEPNGLYMPASAEGTWIMSTNDDGTDPQPLYVEPRVIVSPRKLKNAE